MAASISPAQSAPSAGGNDSGVMMATLRAFNNIKQQISQPLNIPDMRILTDLRFQGVGGNLDVLA